MANNINIVGVCSQNKIQNAIACNCSTNTWTEFLLCEIVALPIQNIDIESIIEIHSFVEIISQRVVKTPVVEGYTPPNGTPVLGQNVPNRECTHLTGKKLVIEGLLKQKIIYTALVNEQSLNTVNYITPFSTFIIIDSNTHINQSFKVTPYIESSNACNLGERNIYKTTSIFISVVKSY